MAAHPSIFALTSSSGVVYAVVCDDHKQPCFQEAANLMQTALQLDGPQSSSGVEREDGQLDEAGTWPSGFLKDLRSIDDEAGSPWRLFTVASVKLGPQSGLRAVGIGSNQNKLKRASNLALAFTVAYTRPQRCSELQWLAAIPIKQGLMESSGITERFMAPIEAVSESSGTFEVTATTPMANATTEVTATPPKAFENWLSGDSPLDCAKQRLVDFHRRHPRLEPEVQSMIRDFRTGYKEQMSCDWSENFADAAHVFSDLRTVLEGDTWKGDDSFGKSWVTAWQKWQHPFNDASLPLATFGKESKRESNYRWYFGRDYSSVAHVPNSSRARSHEQAPPTTPPRRHDATVQNSFGGNATHQVPPPPPRVKQGYQLPTPPPPRALPGKEPISYVREELVSTQLMENMLGLSRSSAEPDTTQVTGLQERDRNDVLEGLNHSQPCDGLTIGTLTSADTIPLGTDLDPQNQYNNLWAAQQIKDPHGKLLVQYNLCCRVIDGENVGYSFGKEVRGKDRLYDMEGVIRAVDHFQKRGIDVIVVTKREDTAQCAFPGGVQVVRAERTDDVMVLKQAHSRNCPIVSRDGYKEWTTDLRVSQELRQWYSESTDLQVRFSWGTAGQFTPDFDLPRPVVRAASQHRQDAWCRQCGQEMGKWSQYKREEHGEHTRYCESCWRKWQSE